MSGSEHSSQPKIDKRTLASIERDNELIIKIGEAFLSNPVKQQFRRKST